MFYDHPGHRHVGLFRHRICRGDQKILRLFRLLQLLLLLLFLHLTNRCNAVRGHRTGSNNSRAEDYLRRKIYKNRRYLFLISSYILPYFLDYAIPNCSSSPVSYFLPYLYSPISYGWQPLLWHVTYFILPIQLSHVSRCFQWVHSQLCS